MLSSPTMQSVGVDFDGACQLGNGNPHLQTPYRAQLELPRKSPPRQSVQTAHLHNQHHECSGWAKIRHPFHPLRGQSFPVLKKACVAGIDVLILRGLEHGTFRIAREWTDWADPDPYDSLDLSPQRFRTDSLLELVELVEQLSSPHVLTTKD